MTYNYNYNIGRQSSFKESLVEQSAGYSIDSVWIRRWYYLSTQPNRVFDVVECEFKLRNWRLLNHNLNLNESDFYDEWTSLELISCEYLGFENLHVSIYDCWVEVAYELSFNRDYTIWKLSKCSRVYRYVWGISSD